MVNLKAEHCTPSIYYQMSRDFQLLGRLYDVVLHSVKTDVDLLYNLPISFNSNVDSIDLLAMTLGFIPKHKYNAKQLKAVCSVLPLIFKNKGSLQAIIVLINAILHAEGIKETMECFEKTYVDDTTGKTMSDHTILIAIPDKLQDLSLINDLLDYILPAGIGYELIQVFTVKIEDKTDLAYEDKISVKSIDIRNADKEVTYGLLPDLTDSDVRDKMVNFGAEDTSGLLIHTTIVSPEKNEEEE